MRLLNCSASASTWDIEIVLGAWRKGFKMIPTARVASEQ